MTKPLSDITPAVENTIKCCSSLDYSRPLPCWYCEVKIFAIRKWGAIWHYPHNWNCRCTSVQEFQHTNYELFTLCSLCLI